MSRKQKKSPQQTFKVSKEDLGEYYSKYLPQFAPGGAYTPTPYKSSAMYNTTGGRAASFINRVVGAGKDAVRTKPPRPAINQRDYQKTTITNNTNEDQYYDSVDGSVETKNVAMGNGLNGWQGMDNYLTGLQEVTDAEGNPTFSQSTWNRDTGGIDYTNPDPSARTVNDIANERLSGIGAQYMTFNNDGNVDTYNTGTNNVAYDADTWSPPSVDNETGDGASSDEIINTRQELSRTSTSTPTQQEQAQIDWCAANPDDCPDADLRYGGGLPRFQGDLGSNELDAFGNPNAAVTPYLLENLSNYDPNNWNDGRGATGEDLGWMSQSQANMDRDTEDMRNGAPSILDGLQSRSQNNQASTTPTPVSTTGNTGSGMFQVNQDLGLPAPPVVAPDIQEPSFSDQLQELGDNNTIPGGAEKLEGPQVSNLLSALSNQQGPDSEGTIEQEASWGDTFGARVNNQARYLGDKVLDSKIVRGASEMADMAVEGAGIFNDWYGKRQEEAKEIQGLSGTTTDAMAAVKSADSDGLYGNFDQNSGLLRPNDGIVSHSAKHGLEMYQDKGEVPEQQGQDTELLRQFLQMASPTFQFSENAIEDQKKSLGYMKNGGQVLDLDEGLIRELIAAGANIEIL